MIAIADVCWHIPWQAVSCFIVENMRFDCGWPPGIRLLLAIFS
jgi:hypothetical protein